MTPSPDIPIGLDTPEFRQAWDEWRQHRAELKKKLTPTGMNRQLSRLAKMGVDRAIAAIEHSIANEWQGIFEDTNGNHRKDSGRRDILPPSDFSGPECVGNEPF